ncbi:MAG TPA: ABC transporter substrate-binding protein [Tepidisphaeraceae bacterium]|jgi:branched-chain amino acid transport system substrate-binding protein
MRRILSALAAAALSCGAFSSTAHAQDTLKVGHYGSLTGAQATFGQSTSNGLKLAVAEINASGGINGRKIELIEYDTKGDPKEAGTVVTRLCTKDKVSVVIGEVASSVSIAAAPICQQNGIPMVSPSSTNPKVTQQGDMIFRTCFIDPFQGYVCAKFAAESKKWKTAALLVDQSQAYAVGLADEFEKNFKKMGGTITIKQQYNTGDTDFSATLTSIRGTSPDVIFVPGYYTDVANVAIQARKLGIVAPLLGGDGWDSAQLTEIGGKSIEGSFYSNHASPDDPSPEFQNFVTKYKDEYGPVPDALAAMGYDAGRIVFAAMKKANSTDGKAIAAALAATKDFPGATGLITIDAQRDAVKSAVILEIKGGRPVYVTSVKP